MKGNNRDRSGAVHQTVYHESPTETSKGQVRRRSNVAWKRRTAQIIHSKTERGNHSAPLEKREQIKQCNPDTTTDRRGVPSTYGHDEKRQPSTERHRIMGQEKEVSQVRNKICAPVCVSASIKQRKETPAFLGRSSKDTDTRKESEARSLSLSLAHLPHQSSAIANASSSRSLSFSLSLSLSLMLEKKMAEIEVL